MSAQIPRRKFSISDYHRMAETGILSENERIELIAGDIVTKIPVGSRHTSCVKSLRQLFTTMLADTVVVWVQNPICLGEYSEPEPDLALLKLRPDLYSEHRPTAKDVFLIVEMTEQAGDYERDVKLPVYAQAGFGEVWLVNIKDMKVEVYTNPAGQEYDMYHKFCQEHTITSVVFPNLRIPVEKIFG
jgi:Uma2 family endonuclease